MMMMIRETKGVREREAERRKRRGKNTDMDPKTLTPWREPLSRSQTVACAEVQAGAFKALQPSKSDRSGRVQCTSSGRTSRQRTRRASGPRASNAVCHGSRARPRAAARHGKSSILPSHESLAQLSNVLHCRVNATTHGAKIANT